MVRKFAGDDEKNLRYYNNKNLRHCSWVCVFKLYQKWNTRSHTFSMVEVIAFFQSVHNAIISCVLSLALILHHRTTAAAAAALLITRSHSYHFQNSVGLIDPYPNYESPLM